MDKSALKDQRSDNHPLHARVFKRQAKTSTTTAKIIKTCHNKRFKNPKALVRSGCLSRSEKTGIKADVKAPSPNKRRNKLGKVNAKIKAECHKPAPNAANISISRIKPTTRDPMVGRLTANIFFKMVKIYWIRQPMMGVSTSSKHDSNKDKRVRISIKSRIKRGSVSFYTA